MEIRLEQVTKSYGSVKAIEPLSLSIQSGKFTTLLGPSGCGKTTLLRLIAGLETPDEGAIYFGRDSVFSTSPRKEVPVHRRGIGMVFQDFALWPHMTVFENVAYGLKAAKQTGQLKEKVADALRMVGLAGLEKRKPGELSGGQQQRVAFARAIVIRPKLLLFDEPLSALDAVRREQMRHELTELVRNLELTALYVTHDQEEAMSMSDEVILMHGGKVIQKGTPETLYYQPADKQAAKFLGKSNWLNGESHMFRPESLHIGCNGSGHSFPAVVKSTSFLGGRYEIVLETKEGIWTGYHHKKLEAGERLHVQVLPEQIINLGERKELAV